MIRTFNRQPFNVATPDKEDVNHKYLNQYNWKGKVENKNFIDVDQESFSDCNNVYVNEEGLLRSRPSIKFKNVKTNINENEIILTDILDVWTFNDVIVYKTFVENNYYLTFVNNNFENALQHISSENIKLILVDKKIFIFSETSFSYYSLSDNTYNDAKDFIYIPTTKIYVNNVETEGQRETVNLLTNKEIYTYIYDNIYQDFTYIYNKDVKIKINDVEYNVKFVEDSERILVDRGRELFDTNYNSLNIPMLWANDNCTLLGFKDEYGRYTAKYSFDNIVYYEIDFPENTLLNTDPIPFVYLTDDGHHIVVFKKDGPYIKSIVKDYYDGTNTIYRFAEWTNLFTYNNILFTVDICEALDYPVAFSAHFLRYDKFCFTYASDYFDNNVFQNMEGYGTLNLVTKTDEGFVKKELFSTKASKYETDITGKLNTTSYTSFTVPDLNYTNLSTNVNSVLKFSSFQAIGVTSYGGSGRFRVVCSGTFVKNSTTIYTFDIKADDYWEVGIDSNGMPIYGYSIDDVNKENRILLAIVKGTTVDSKVILSISPVAINDDYPLSSKKVISYYGYKYLWFMPLVKNEYTCISKVAELENITCINLKYKLLRITDLSTNNALLIDVLKSDNTITEYDIDNAGLQYAYTVDYGEPLLNDVFFKYEYSSLLNYSGTAVYISYMKQDGTYSNVNGINKKRWYKYVDKIYIGERYISQIIGEFDFLENKDINTKFFDNGFITNDYLYIGGKEYEIQTRPYQIIGLSYRRIPLLFSCIPLYISSSKLYLSNKDGNKKYLYTSDVKNIRIEVIIDNNDNYFVPDNYIELDEIYLSKNKTLYITSGKRTKDGDYLWYFPKINNQEFDYDISNLHPISSNEVAIFLEDSIYYVNYDTNVNAYRYYKSKIQVGCKKGSDVLTTFDGKYIIFVSDRGLVAMSYQQFVASTEQALSFMSDNIYDTFYKYITEINSENAIKLYKYSNYIFIYKEDSNKGFIFDLRTLSWWPISIDKNISRFVTMNNEVKILSNMKLFNLNKSDINYYDYDGIKRTKVDWFIQSQKLHLGAVNYYKHIVNMTFNSVHDLSLLKENDYNAIDLNFKLQINNYRKQVNGNIGNKDDYKVVNYNVEIVRTFVQRLNYSKVNEFQYLLSYDDKNSVNVPFSVSGIIVKYKIGGEVR